MTAGHLGTIADNLIETLCTFFNDIVLAGKILEAITPIFYGARLIGLSKPDGGVRPIAIGLTLRRIIAKICMKKLKPSHESLFLPQQLGVGLRSGCGGAIHSTLQFALKVHKEPKFFTKDRHRECIQHSSS